MNPESNKPNEERKAPAGTPDPAILHTTDPQEHMHGPLSDAMHGIGGAVENTDTNEPAVERAERDSARERSSD
ncbi:hypothetical protein EPD60_12300 [Flaviaesturariibacter flavus]|uniref:Uncharacterized protein n=1 Tax=Flaviaesturariibacter flavus TaxID=2502780 RepID=A0A4V2NVH8_9BACT|nr:hypothetical protein [Flaviaesturariibacter flavus]TCJ13572.1 hypothetical protein EPD60_12300 [Flaviaesturariibacter flavus]